MALRGNKPKDDGQKVTRHPLTQGWTEVPDLPFDIEKAFPDPVSRPKLPGRMPAATKRWWSAISGMPHCVLWGESDWSFAIDTGLLHSRFVKGESSRAGELRMRERVMGTTVEARRDKRIRYVNPLAFTQILQAEEDDEAEMDNEVSDFAAARRRRLENAE